MRRQGRQGTAPTASARYPARSACGGAGRVNPGKRSRFHDPAGPRAGSATGPGRAESRRSGRFGRGSDLVSSRFRPATVPPARARRAPRSAPPEPPGPDTVRLTAGRPAAVCVPGRPRSPFRRPQGPQTLGGDQGDIARSLRRLRRPGRINIPYGDPLVPDPAPDRPYRPGARPARGRMGRSWRSVTGRGAVRPALVLMTRGQSPCRRLSLAPFLPAGHARPEHRRPDRRAARVRHRATVRPRRVPAGPRRRWAGPRRRSRPHVLHYRPRRSHTDGFPSGSGPAGGMVSASREVDGREPAGFPRVTRRGGISASDAASVATAASRLIECRGQQFRGLNRGFGQL